MLVSKNIIPAGVQAKENARESAALLGRLRDRVLAESLGGKGFGGLGKEDALETMRTIRQPEDVIELSLIAFRANRLCQLANGEAEVGIHQCGSTYFIEKPCAQGCAFCVLATDPAGWNPAPKRFRTPDEFVQEALEAERGGASHYKIVTLKQRLSKKEFNLIVEAYRQIKERTSLTLCGSFGAYLSTEEMLQLREVGVGQINCNIECARSHAPALFGTKDLGNPVSRPWRARYERLLNEGKADPAKATRKLMSDGREHLLYMFDEEAYVLWDAKRRFIETAIGLGMKVCCGGIVGAGESDSQRVEMFLELKELGVHTSPFNVFVPQKGTPLEDAKPLGPMDILKSLALFRLISPAQKIMYNAGVQYMGGLLPLVLMSGVSGLGSGSYLNKDNGGGLREMCSQLGLGFAGANQGNGCEGGAY